MDLGIVKSGPVAVHPGATVTWTLRVTNYACVRDSPPAIAVIG
jgi:hypothetical protein